MLMYEIRMYKGKGDGKVQHQINKEAVLYRGINGEKERQKNVVKSCKYIIHLCKKKMRKNGCVDVVCLVLFL
jgi:hypothetical protein